MAAIKFCEKCNTECYWIKDEAANKWVLMDSETEMEHWKSCPMRNMSRGQMNPVLRKPAAKDAMMDFLLAMDQRLKKLEDKVYGNTRQ